MKTNEIHVSTQRNASHASESMFGAVRARKEGGGKKHVGEFINYFANLRSAEEETHGKLFVYNLAISLSSLVLCGAEWQRKIGVDILAERRKFS